MDTNPRPSSAFLPNHVWDQMMNAARVARRIDLLVDGGVKAPRPRPEVFPRISSPQESNHRQWRHR